MNTVTNMQGSPGVMRSLFRLLNTPTMKEGVKNVAGSVTFAFGLLAAYDFYQIARGRKLCSEASEGAPRWKVVTNQMIVLFSKVSLILSAGVSRPGIYLSSKVMSTFLSVSQMETLFGESTIFAYNPWHPRHYVSIIAVSLALPSLVQMVYKSTRWVWRKLQGQRVAVENVPVDQRWLSDSKVRGMIVYNTLTSRPSLHLGNYLARLILNLY
jgi:hypothetical protein